MTGAQTLCVPVICVSPEAPGAVPPPPVCSSVVPQGDRQLYFSSCWHWLGMKDESLPPVCYLTHHFVCQMPAGDQPATSHERLFLLHSVLYPVWPNSASEATKRWSFTLNCGPTNNTHINFIKIVCCCLHWKYLLFFLWPSTYISGHSKRQVVEHVILHISAFPSLSELWVILDGLECA